MTSPVTAVVRGFGRASPPGPLPSSPPIPVWRRSPAPSRTRRMRLSEAARTGPAHRAVQPGFAMTNVTEAHRQVFEALTGGPPWRSCLFPCLCDGKPAAIVSVTVYPPENDGGEAEYVISPLFISRMPDMTLTDDDGMSSHPFPRRPTDLVIPRQCRELIRLGALVAISGSGCKDSRGMTILVSRVVPREQLLVVHVPLGEVEWPGAIEHIENTTPSGVPLIPARTASGKSLVECIKERGRFPDSGRVLHGRHEPHALAAQRPQPPRRSGVVRPASESTASRRRTCSASSPRPASRRIGVVRPARSGSVAASASSTRAPTRAGRRSCVPASTGCTSTIVTPRGA